MVVMTSDSRDAREWERFANRIANAFVAPGVDQDDLRQEAFLALLEALPSYDETSGISLKNFVRRKVRARLSSLYRKSLNLVQIEQYWVLSHKSGDSDLAVRDLDKTKLEAVAKSNPSEYTEIRHVKIVVPIGPRLDDGWDEKVSEDDATTLSDQIGVFPDQEWSLIAKQRTDSLKVVVGSDSQKSSEIETIVSMRREGHDFSTIAKTLGKTADAVRQTFSRQRRMRKSKAA